MFVGTAMVATSVGITARVLSGMGLLDAPTARIILGAAVIDDILGLLVLAMVSSAAAGSVNYLEILTTAGLAIGFTAFVALVGAPVVTRVAPKVEQLRSGQGTFIFGLVLCLGFVGSCIFHRSCRNHWGISRGHGPRGSSGKHSQDAQADGWGD